MTVQKLETYGWGLVQRSPQALETGATVDLGVDAELKVLGPNSVKVVYENYAGWEGSEMPFTYQGEEINTNSIQAEGNLLDIFTGHKISYQWTSSEPAAA